MGRHAVAPMGRLVVERLVQYYLCLGARLDGHPVFSSNQLARILDLDETQVRKDMAQLGLRGRPGVGFVAKDLLRTVEARFGFHETTRAAIIGVGHLGTALAGYRGFSGFGVKIEALFDSDPRKVGRRVHGLEVLPAARLEELLPGKGIAIAILCVPDNQAQAVTDHLVMTGIRAVWNFTSADLAVPAKVFVRSEKLSVGLAELLHHLRPAAGG